MARRGLAVADEMHAVGARRVDASVRFGDGRIVVRDDQLGATIRRGNVVGGGGQAVGTLELEAFSKFPTPRNTEVFEPTFKGIGIVRSADITKDARYGHNPPYHGMPPGHLPVRSYLAVPVKGRSGNVIGGLFFGHSERAGSVSSTNASRSASLRGRPWPSRMRACKLRLRRRVGSRMISSQVSRTNCARR
jgi:hypothetical protein